MAYLAGRRHPSRDVVRVFRALVILQVAARAIGTDCRVVTTDMTRRAVHLHVRSGERELRLIVVERRRLPRYRGVASLARCRNASRRVIRILGAVVVFGVAAEAVGARALELASDMARGAFQRRVRTRQRKARQLQMIERCREPRVHAGMAGPAIGTESCRFMTWSCCLCVRLGVA